MWGEELRGLGKFTPSGHFFYISQNHESNWQKGGLRNALSQGPLTFLDWQPNGKGRDRQLYACMRTCANVAACAFDEWGCEHACSANGGASAGTRLVAWLELERGSGVT